MQNYWSSIKEEMARWLMLATVSMGEKFYKTQDGVSSKSDHTCWWHRTETLLWLAIELNWIWCTQDQLVCSRAVYSIHLRLCRIDLLYHQIVYYTYMSVSQIIIGGACRWCHSMIFASNPNSCPRKLSCPHPLHRCSACCLRWSRSCPSSSRFSSWYRSW